MIIRAKIMAQSTVEFTFAMIVMMFLIYGMVQVFRWAGMDLAQRRFAQDSTLTDRSSGDPAVELSPVFDQFQPIAADYHGKITSTNSIKR